MQIPVKLLKKSEDHYSMSKEQIASTKERIRNNDAIKLDGINHAVQRRNMLRAVAAEPLDLAFERYIGNNDLLPINYLQIGFLRSKSVGRIRFFDLTVNKNALATGFLISPDLMLTNHHVFQKGDSFKDAFIEFDYAFDVDGSEKPKITFAVDPAKFFYSSENLDFTIVGIKSVDETGVHQLSDRGYLVLNPETGKAGLGDFASIIQFPDGNWQEIGLRENKLLDINRPDALIYSTDTSTGSSGSPVFNDQWQVIALHSAGVAKTDNNGNYLDQDGKIIPQINGTIDSSRIVWISNTGMRISSILNNVFNDPDASQSVLIQFIKSSVYSDNKMKIAVSQPSTSEKELFTETSANSNQAPLTKMEATPNISITININGNSQPVITAGQSSVNIAANKPAEPVLSTFESKEDTERNMDYSQCQGFDTFFLGFETPLPTPGNQLKRQISTYTANANQFVLKYYHYSTIHHSVRRMPVISAVNVDGNPAERQDNATRVDNWLRDNRIDFDVQLTDAYYQGSHFDKGHMSRREDAKWDDTADDAERDAKLTCMYTNACPQVPNINRAIFGFHGLWGQLEQIVLEKGVEQENGKTGKICVYNGPVFVDTDPVFKGVQTPLRFFKIIVWTNSAGQKKTTGFVLSQENLVGGIQFEELQFDQEFKEHQASIAYIENLTSLTFTTIRDWDTFIPDPATQNEVMLLTSDELTNLIKKHSS